MKAKKTIFKLDFESEIRIIGIFCPLPDYRICWLINNHLGWGLKRLPDFQFSGAKRSLKDWYSVFGYEHEALQQKIFVINNLGNDGANAFTKPPKLDYLMLVRAEYKIIDITQFVKSLRKIRQIIAAYGFDDVLSPHKNEFFYDFETYLTSMVSF